MNTQLLNPFRELMPKAFLSTWTSPSNIAFIKYWGKKGHQLPANPSLSMTLSECVTKTQTSFSPADALTVELSLDGTSRPDFARKIQTYLESLLAELPWLSTVEVRISTSNTFPHGTGIASSASGLSAFALNLTDYLYQLAGLPQDDLFFRRASYLARLASGSACRSVYGGFTTWGESTFAGSSDEYATPFSVHPSFMQLCDSVLVVSGKEKEVSSRAGHGRMEEHFFAKARFDQAKFHFQRCADALKSGDFEVVGTILEAEALALHALMMTSPEAYTLLKPQSLTAMQAIWAFRQETKIPLYFTLDAGPNLHLIYFESDRHKIQTFLGHELAGLGENMIHDRVGEGPKRC